jgi:hypothetical protein
MPSPHDGRLSRSLDIELLSLLRGSRAIDIEACSMPRGSDTSAEWNRESLAHFFELRRTGNLDNPDKIAITSAAEAEAAVDGCFEKRFFSQVALGVLHSPIQREHSLKRPFSLEEFDVSSSRLGDLWASASPLNSPFSSLPQWLSWEHKREIAQAEDKFSSCNAREIVGIDNVFDRSSSSELKQDRKGIARTLLPLLDLSAGGNIAELLKEGSRTTLLRLFRPQIDSESFSFIPPHSQHQQFLSPLLSTHLTRVLLLASEQFFSGSVADTSLNPKYRRGIICNRVIKKTFFS